MLIGSNNQIGIWFIGGLIAGASEAPSGWSVAGIGDFNGDGTDDILWIDGSGDVGIWFMRNSGVQSAAAIATVPLGWSIVGVGDFDGNGTSDILWRDTAGDMGVWLRATDKS